MGVLRNQAEGFGFDGERNRGPQSALKGLSDWAQSSGQGEERLEGGWGRLKVRSRGSGRAKAISPGEPHWSLAHSREAAPNIQMLLLVASCPGTSPWSVLQSALAFPLRKKPVFAGASNPTPHNL